MRYSMKYIFVVLLLIAGCNEPKPVVNDTFAKSNESLSNAIADLNNTITFAIASKPITHIASGGCPTK